MNYNYKTKGTCSTNINFRIENNKVYDVKYERGCPGNLKAISKLVDGRDIDDVISTLKGIKCGFKETSCADQLAKALEQVKNK